MLLKQIVRFLVVGIITFLIDLFVTYTSYYLLNYEYAGFCSALGFISGFIFNYTVNKKYVFTISGNRRFSTQHQIVMFAGLAIFNLIISSVMVGYFVDHLLFNIIICKVVMTALIATWNFILLKKVIFS